MSAKKEYLTFTVWSLDKVSNEELASGLEKIVESIRYGHTSGFDGDYSWDLSESEKEAQ